LVFPQIEKDPMILLQALPDPNLEIKEAFLKKKTII
tara:strand:- start:497 stop:604 length:108 start_codon:yes stop_codon:yes gene_type:complete